MPRRRGSLVGALTCMMCLVVAVTRGAVPPSDSLLSQQWYLNDGVSATEQGRTLHVFGAWQRYTGTTSDRIGVMSGGTILTSHHELTGRVTNAGNEPVSALATKMAGAAAASGDDGIGVAGLSWAARVFGWTCDGGNAHNASTVLAGADWFQGQGVPIIAMGWERLAGAGDRDETRAYISALKQVYAHGQLAVCPMRTNAGVSDDPSAPEAWSLPKLGMGTLNVNGMGSMAAYLTGNHSSPDLDVIVPTLSPFNGGILSCDDAGTYSTASDNAMAVALTAGAASLLRGYAAGLGQTLTNDDLRGILIASAAQSSPMAWDQLYGYGWLDVDQALDMVGPGFVRRAYTAVGYSSIGAPGQFIFGMNVTAGNPWGLTPGYYESRACEVTLEVPLHRADFAAVRGAWANGAQCSGHLDGGLFAPHYAEVVRDNYSSSSTVVLKTRVFKLSDALGAMVPGYYPNPATLQWSYTVLGSRRAMTVANTGPVPSALINGQWASCTVAADGGTWSYSYDWEYRNVGPTTEEFPWVHFSASPTTQTTVTNVYDRQVRVTVSDGVESVCDTLPCLINQMSAAAPVVTIGGPMVLPAGQGGTWSANGWQGQTCGQFAYEWRVRPKGSTTWSDIVGTGKILMWPTYSNSATELQATVRGAAPGVYSATILQSPGPVTDLGGDFVSDDEVWVAWTSPGTPEVTGPAVEYDARISESNIQSDQTFYSARSMVVGSPGEPGAWESAHIDGLEPFTYYWVAVKVKDSAGNWSPYSNVVRVRTLNTYDPGGWERAAPVASGQSAGAGLSGAKGVSPSSTSSLELRYSVSWDALESGGRVTLSCSNDAGDTDDGRAVVSVGARDSSAGDTLAITGSSELRDLGSALRSRDSRMELGHGWFPTSLAPVCLPADQDGVQYAVAGVSLIHGGAFTNLDKSAWVASPSLMQAGDTLLVEYVATALTDPGAIGRVWMTLRGPKSQMPLKSGQSSDMPSTRPAALSLTLDGTSAMTGVLRLGVELPGDGTVKLDILDIGGRRVRSVADTWMAAGRYSLTWDGRDAGGRTLHPGVYFCRLNQSGRSLVKKIVWTPAGN
jgi:hypothetical protein